MKGVSAFVLVGGKSSRMGTDKALLEFGGTTLLSRALKTAAAVADVVRIVGNAEKYSAFGEVIEDKFPGHGPLAGIHAALRATTTDLNLMLAVDMPFMNSGFLRLLVEQAQAIGAEVVVPRSGGRLHPLCAVYRRTFGDMAETALARGQNKIDLLFRPSSTRIVEQEEIESLAFSLRMFDNVNTVEELQRAQAGATERS